jgi:hypothetical protein
MVEKNGFYHGKSRPYYRFFHCLATFCHVKKPTLIKILGTAGFLGTGGNRKENYFLLVMYEIWYY